MSNDAPPTKVERSCRGCSGIAFKWLVFLTTLIVLCMLGAGSYVFFKKEAVFFHTKSKAERSITIKVGLEKEAKADYVIWRIGFQSTGSDLNLLQEKFVKDRDTILKFLKQKGFQDFEILVGGPRLKDQHTQGSLYTIAPDPSKVRESARYVISSRIKVSTDNVDSVVQAVKEADILIKEGIVLTQSATDVNPRYYLKNQSQLEQELYTGLIDKAKKIAAQLEEKEGIKIGEIKRISSRGPIKILGQAQSGETGYNYDAYNSRLRGPIKVATLEQDVEFELKE